MIDIDRRNREALRQGPPMEPPEIPLTAMDIISGQWKADATEKDIEDDYAEQRHEENVDKKRVWGQG